MMLGLYNEAPIWSYLINIFIAIAFIYLIVIYIAAFGTGSMFRHLTVCYALIVALSFHQIWTGVHYPNTPYHDGVACIFMGAVNNTSLAIAGFGAVLWLEALRTSRPVRFVSGAFAAFLLGLVIVYINGSRGIFLAMILLLLLICGKEILVRIQVKSMFVRVALSALLVMGTIGLVTTLSEYEIWEYEGGGGTIRELIFDPALSILRGETAEQQLTSVNLRVTAVGIGLQNWKQTFGFGIGPGASTAFVEKIYGGIARSIHIFQFQMLIECGWLFVAMLVWLVRCCSRRGPLFWPILIFLIGATSSMSSGAITNYFFLACAAFTLYGLGTPLVGSLEPVSRFHGKPPQH